MCRLPSFLQGGVFLTFMARCNHYSLLGFEPTKNGTDFRIDFSSLGRIGIQFNINSCGYQLIQTYQRLYGKCSLHIITENKHHMYVNVHLNSYPYKRSHVCISNACC